MKKLILIFIIGLCAFPARAQESKIIKGSLGGGAALTDAVSLQVAKQTLTGPQIRLAQITNLSGESLLRVQLPQTVVPADNQIVSARVLNGTLFRKIVFPEDDSIYLPLALNDSKSVLYRGMGLKIADIEDILVDGLKSERSRYEELFFSADISEATFHANYKAVIFSTETNLLLPVVVKVKATPKSQLWPSLRYDIANDYVFLHDIPAKFIADVMVFLEVNGEGAWYKAILVDGELTFVPTPTRLFKKSDLIIRRFEVPRWF